MFFSKFIALTLVVRIENDLVYVFNTNGLFQCVLLFITEKKTNMLSISIVIEYDIELIKKIIY